jgi:branched-chain amino acid aminotransferase
MDNKKIWMDGKIINWDEANVHIMTHTLHYGLGVFEGIRCYKTDNGSAIFRLKEHIERLFNSAHIVGMKIPYSKEAITDAIKTIIKTNGLESCYIRPIVFLGHDKFGLNCKGISVHCAVVVWQWGAYLGEESLTKGIKVKVSSFTRHHINISMTKAKVCGNYVNSILAKVEAVDNGYEEAILLDASGNVAEGSGENIFIVRRGVIKTPPITSVLEGITRDSIIKIAADYGIKVKEEVFSRDELYIADEAFFSGTAAEITPIREVDNRVIGKGAIGETTKKLQETFFDIVKGRNNKYKEWLAYI